MTEQSNERLVAKNDEHAKNMFAEMRSWGCRFEGTETVKANLRFERGRVRTDLTSRLAAVCHKPYQTEF